MRQWSGILVSGVRRQRSKRHHQRLVLQSFSHAPPSFHGQSLTGNDVDEFRARMDNRAESVVTSEDVLEQHNADWLVSLAK